MVSATLWRSLLLAVLAVAVLGMHHTPLAPLGHEMPGEPIAPAHRASGAHMLPGFEVPGAPVPHGSGVAGAHPTDEHGAPGGHGHDLLHLCLAIMAALTGLALVLVALGAAPATAGDAAGRRTGAGGYARPPPLPVRRRLAVLCVLRQ